MHKGSILPNRITRPSAGSEFFTHCTVRLCRRWWFAALSCSIFGFVLALRSALAACVPGLQCEANGTVETPADFSVFQAIGTGPGNAALVADNGGQITGTSLNITAAGANAYGASVDGSANITLGGNTSIAGSHGVHMQGTGSTFSMTGGNIAATTTTGDGTALNVSGIGGGGHSVTLNNVSVAAHQNAINIGDATSTLSADNLSISTSTTSASSALFNQGKATLTNSHIAVQIGDGIYSKGTASNQPAIVNMLGGDIAILSGGRGAVADSYGQVHFDGVTITGPANNSMGIMLYDNANGTFQNGVINAGHGVQVWLNSSLSIANSAVTSTGAGRYGVLIRSGSASITDHSTIATAGASRIALVLLGESTVSNHVSVDASDIVATGAGSTAVRANGATNTVNLNNHSTMRGDRLVLADRCASSTCTDGAVARLTLNASNSQLFGHALVRNASTLAMNLANGAHWTLRPSLTGTVRSDVTFLSLDAGSTIAFDPTSTQYQMLVVGSGDRLGSTAVYHAPASGVARIQMNTRLDAGGALTDQHTDRLIVEGDVSGITQLTVVPVAGSLGAETGTLADQGISLVQVYGNATSDAFILDGGYVAVGPYAYHLYAFDPATSDPGQRVSGSGPFWDFRLQSTASLTPPLAPQIPSYLLAPGALFQAGLFDVATLHRRLGDTQHSGIPPGDIDASREWFLRTYGGDYHYRSQRMPYGYDADTRYVAMQGGGNFWRLDTREHRLRVGLVGSVGGLSFAPRHVVDSRKTAMDTWLVAPTLTWRHATGAYVDVVAAYGGFRGNVANRVRGNTALLAGKRIAASLQAGVDMSMGGVTVQPQMQVVYQRLEFDRRRDVDGIDVRLGTPDQWTLRAGGKVRKSWTLADGGSVQIHGKLHVAHTVGDGDNVWLSHPFALSKAGTVAEVGLGMDAVLAGGKTKLYADLTRQQRLGTTGYRGWAANLGVKILF